MKKTSLPTGVLPTRVPSDHGGGSTDCDLAVSSPFVGRLTHHKKAPPIDSFTAEDLKFTWKTGCQVSGGRLS